MDHDSWAWKHLERLYRTEIIAFQQGEEALDQWAAGEISERQRNAIFHNSTMILELVATTYKN